MGKILLWVIVAIVVLGGAFYLMQGTGGNVAVTPPAPTPAPTPPDTNSPTPATPAPMVAAVSYNDQDGFFPAEVTIKKGGTVSWTNSSSAGMWVASGPHPAHTGYSGTSLAQHCPDTSKTAFDACANAATYTFKFDKVGTWPYHNHSNATKFGRVIVVE